MVGGREELYVVTDNEEPSVKKNSSNASVPWLFSDCSLQTEGNSTVGSDDDVLWHTSAKRGPVLIRFREL